MTKYLLVGSLCVFSTFAVACSNSEQATEKAKNANTDTIVLKDDRQVEIEKRKERAQQKGNGLDSFDSNTVTKPNKDQESKNGLDSFKPN